MEQNPKSEGKCLFCGGTFAKTGINRHLQTHLRQKAKENAPGQSYLIKIEADPKWNSPSYFLVLWVDSSATMKNIDSYLRDIWLECCGHLSAFTDPKQQRGLDIFKAKELLKQSDQKKFEKFREDVNREIQMNLKTNKVFYEGLKLEYEYDFGSSTKLLLIVVEEYPVKADKKIVLLSRN
jgi:hypothetical protein